MATAGHFWICKTVDQFPPRLRYYHRAITTTSFLIPQPTAQRVRGTRNNVSLKRNVMSFPESDQLRGNRSRSIIKQVDQVTSPDRYAAIVVVVASHRRPESVIWTSYEMAPSWKQLIATATTTPQQEFPKANPRITLKWVLNHIFRLMRGCYCHLAWLGTDAIR